MKKKRFQWKSLALLLATVTALGGLYYYQGFCRKKSSDVYSVILYQRTEDEWGTLIQESREAEEDLNVDVNYIYLSENDTAEDQIKEVNRRSAEKSSRYFNGYNSRDSGSPGKYDDFYSDYFVETAQETLFL